MPVSAGSIQQGHHVSILLSVLPLPPSPLPLPVGSMAWTCLTACAWLGLCETFWQEHYTGDVSYQVSVPLSVMRAPHGSSGGGAMTQCIRPIGLSIH